MPLSREKLLKESQAVFELKREEKRLSAEVTGSKSTSKNLEGQLTQLDKEAARQQELLYSAEFQIESSRFERIKVLRNFAPELELDGTKFAPQWHDQPRNPRVEPK